jgi:hypothetical protein
MRFFRKTYWHKKITVIDGRYKCDVVVNTVTGGD